MPVLRRRRGRLPAALPRAVRRRRRPGRRRAHPRRGAARRDGQGRRDRRRATARPLGGHGPRVRHRRRDQSTPSATSRWAACPPSTPKSSPAPTTSPSATSTDASRSGRPSATAAPRWRCRSARHRHTKGSWLVDLAESGSPSRPSTRPSPDPWPSCAATSRCCSPTPRWTAHGARLVPGHPDRPGPSPGRDGAAAPALPPHARAPRSTRRARPCRSAATPSAPSAVRPSTCAAAFLAHVRGGPRPDRARAGGCWPAAVEAVRVQRRRRREGRCRWARPPGGWAPREAAPTSRSPRSGPFAGTVEVDLDAVVRRRPVPHPRRHGRGQDQPARRRRVRLLADVPGARSKQAAAQRPRRARAPFRPSRSSSPPSGRRLRIERSPEFTAPQDPRHGHDQGAGPGRAVRAHGAPLDRPEHPPRRDRRRRPGRAGPGAGAVQQGRPAPPGRLRRVPAGHARGAARSLLERLFDVSSFVGIEDWFAERRRKVATRSGRRAHGLRRRPRRAGRGARRGPQPSGAAPASRHRGTWSTSPSCPARWPP